MQRNKPSLSPFRSRFFPVYNDELVGFFLLSGCFFFIALDYALLRSLKDVLVMCLKRGGGEAIGANKFFVIPSMVGFKIGYDFMSSRVSKYNRFYYVFGYFIVFFGFTVLVLYPNRDNWQIVGLTEKLNNAYLLNRFWPVWLMLRHWPVTLIYIHAECVGSFGLGVSLWGIANYISSVDQSKRIYPLFSLFAGMGTLVAGVLSFDSERVPKEVILQICIAGFVLLILLYYLLIREVKSKPEVYASSNKPKKKKLKLGLKESFSVLFRSRYFTGITLLVLGYSVVIVFLEGIYRDALKTFLKKMILEKNLDLLDNLKLLQELLEKHMSKFTGGQLIGVGALQMICVPLAPYVMRRSWNFGASLVPKILLAGTCIFFGLLFFGQNIPGISHLDDTKILQITVLVGLAIIVVVKTQKYMSFDPTKERLYIVLDDHEKTIGKSAVDGVGSRMGKGFSAVVTTFFIVPIFGSIAGAKVLIGSLIFGTIGIWLWAVKDVGAQFHTRLQAYNQTNKSTSNAKKMHAEDGLKK